MILFSNNLFAFPILNPNYNPNFLSHQILPNSGRLFHRHCRRDGDDSEWGSNAESFRFRFPDYERNKFGRKNGRKWWSDDFYEDDNDDFDDIFGNEEEEDFWDKFWIFKVFKSYGYMLPAIIASMLLGTGPQAFLMALALPLGQSAISLAIDKLWGNSSDEAPRRRRPQNGEQPFSERSYTNFRDHKKEESSSDHKEKFSYQSWDSADSSEKRWKRSNFGGWDDLNNQKESQREQRDVKFERVMNDGKLSKRRRYKDQPLLLRLLIAVFPFLGSWTRIL